MCVCRLVESGREREKGRGRRRGVACIGGKGGGQGGASFSGRQTGTADRQIERDKQHTGKFELTDRYNFTGKKESDTPNGAEGGGVQGGGVSRRYAMEKGRIEEEEKRMR